MLDQTQKQRFVGTMVNNMEYINKELTKKHICQFVKAHPNFCPRETIRKIADDSFISFIEITGFIQLGKSHVEMYIGAPVGYPSRPPVFLLAIDRNNFIINDEQKLLQFNLIALEKNQKNEDFIRLRFPLIEKQWNPKIQTLNTTFTSLMQVINNPPLMRPKNQFQVPQNRERISNAAQDPTTKIKRLNSKQVTEVIGKLYADLAQVLIGKQSLDQSNQILDYNESREDFFKQHLISLKTKLVLSQKNIEKQYESLRADLKETEETGNCDKFFDYSQEESNKINTLSQQQALKQAEVKLRSKMQKQQDTKFSDYKKIMKILYEKMFQNQTKLLKSLK